MSTARRRALLAASLLALGLPLRARAAALATLPQSASLAADLQSALGARQALVVMVSLRGCPYCKLVRESYLAPLHAAGQPVVQLEMGQALPLADLQGRASTHAQVVRALGVGVAPTVLFFGRGGAEPAERLEGVPLPDFYGAYLQQRVDAANRAVAGG